MRAKKEPLNSRVALSLRLFLRAGRFGHRVPDLLFLPRPELLDLFGRFLPAVLRCLLRFGALRVLEPLEPKLEGRVGEVEHPLVTVFLLEFYHGEGFELGRIRSRGRLGSHCVASFYMRVSRALGYFMGLVSKWPFSILHLHYTPS